MLRLVLAGPRKIESAGEERGVVTHCIGENATLVLMVAALKECTNAVGGLKKTKYPHYNAQKACSIQIGG
eukprot:3094637-Prymnesium_polylepis.1